MPLEFTVSALVTILVVLDPIGLVPSFIAITQDLPAASRRSVALRMRSLSLPAFRIAGGLLLFSIASEMVFGVRVVRQTETAEHAIEERVRNIAAFPLAIPLMAGPGAITASVLLSGRSGGDPLRLGLLLGVIAASMLLCFIVFELAGRIGNLLGNTATSVASRILGVLLAALAVQFVIDGVRAAMAG